MFVRSQQIRNGSGNEAETASATTKKNTRILLRIPKQLVGEWKKLLGQEKTPRKVYEYGITTAAKALNLSAQLFYKLQKRARVSFGNSLWLQKVKMALGDTPFNAKANRGCNINDQERKILFLNECVDTVGHPSAYLGAAQPARRPAAKKKRYLLSKGL